MTAPIAGVVTWLEVNPGTVSRSGTTVWGGILDLSEIDARRDLTPEQAGHIDEGQTAEVRQAGRERVWAGRGVSLALKADWRTGKVPALVRIEDVRERLRFHIEVTVGFPDGKEEW